MVKSKAGRLLAVDIGNTNVTLGVFDKDRLAGMWRMASDPNRTSDEYGGSILSFLNASCREKTKNPRGRIFSGVSVATVVPALGPVFQEVARKYFGVEPFVFHAGLPVGIKIRVDHPAEVGADRILNALAAYHLYRGPAIVIDFGTATTFDCVSGRGDYLGGAILPGPGLLVEGLAGRTARLPKVEIAEPGRAIGKNTVQCIQAGVFYGYIGMVDKLLRMTLKEMLPGPKPRIFLTGGLSVLFGKKLSFNHRVVPDLTLQGLRLAYEFSNTLRSPLAELGDERSRKAA